MQKTNFLLLKKFKNTESAKLCGQNVRTQPPLEPFELSQVMTCSIPKWSALRNAAVSGVADSLTGCESKQRSVANLHPEMPFFPKTATQKDQKHPSLSTIGFFSLKKFSKASKSIYLFLKNISWSQHKASQHFKKLVILQQRFIVFFPPKIKTAVAERHRLTRCSIGNLFRNVFSKAATQKV